jgi:hypothetical protein
VSLILLPYRRTYNNIRPLTHIYGSKVLFLILAAFSVS